MDEYKDESSGKVVPGYEARIVGTTGEELSSYEIGDLLVKGDSIGSGYFNKHEATKSKFIGEWLVTGDKYYRDDEGYYFYCGRSDEMIKICGMWVSPYEIEGWILKSEYVLEAAVVGIVNHSGLINTKGFVVLKDNIEPSDQIKSEIMSLVDQNLPSFKRLNNIAFVKELPKTATGKIQRYKLQETKAPKLQKSAI
jgi:benzoate-CoA ligase